MKTTRPGQPAEHARTLKKFLDSFKPRRVHYPRLSAFAVLPEKQASKYYCDQTVTDLFQDLIASEEFSQAILPVKYMAAKEGPQSLDYAFYVKRLRRIIDGMLRRKSTMSWPSRKARGPERTVAAKLILDEILDDIETWTLS